jgi:hypothetical protein
MTGILYTISPGAANRPQSGGLIPAAQLRNLGPMTLPGGLRQAPTAWERKEHP